MVNGFDAFGKFRGKDAGFLHDLTGRRPDRNPASRDPLRRGRRDQPRREARHDRGVRGPRRQRRAAETTEIKQLRISLSELAGIASRRS
jgi:hypothetical protein